MVSRLPARVIIWVIIIITETGAKLKSAFVTNLQVVLSIFRWYYLHTHWSEVLFYLRRLSHSFLTPGRMMALPAAVTGRHSWEGLLRENVEGQEWAKQQRERKAYVCLAPTCLWQGGCREGAGCLSVMFLSSCWDSSSVALGGGGGLLSEPVRSCPRV